MNGAELFGADWKERPLWVGTGTPDERTISRQYQVGEFLRLHPFFAVKEWVEYILIDVIYFFIYVLLYRQKYQKLLTSCSIHTESNSHQSAITRCPYLRIKHRLRLTELVSVSHCLAHFLSLKIITDSSDKWTLIVVWLSFCNSLRRRSDCITNKDYC